MFHNGFAHLLVVIYAGTENSQKCQQTIFQISLNKRSPRLLIQAAQMTHKVRHPVNLFMCYGFIMIIDDCHRFIATIYL